MVTGTFEDKLGWKTVCTNLKTDLSGRLVWPLSVQVMTVATSKFSHLAHFLISQCCPTRCFIQLPTLAGCVCVSPMALYSDLPKLKIAILGSEQTGKSAIVVRYLTRRYISEYCSQSDFLYRHAMYLDDNMQIEVDILDTSGRLDSEDLLEHIGWANAFVVVFSISDSNSFLYACQLLETISLLKSSQGCPIILLGNKTDLSDHARQINTSSGEKLSAQYDCPFYEVSAAENYLEVIRAFRGLIRQSKSILVQQSESALRPKTSPSLKVSRMFGQMLAKMGKKDRKKAKVFFNLKSTIQCINALMAPWSQLYKASQRE